MFRGICRIWSNESCEIGCRIKRWEERLDVLATKNDVDTLWKETFGNNVKHTTNSIHDWITERRSVSFTVSAICSQVVLTTPQSHVWQHYTALGASLFISFITCFSCVYSWEAFCNTSAI